MSTSPSFLALYIIYVQKQSTILPSAEYYVTIFRCYFNLGKPRKCGVERWNILNGRLISQPIVTSLFIDNTRTSEVLSTAVPVPLFSNLSKKILKYKWRALSHKKMCLIKELNLQLLAQQYCQCCRSHTSLALVLKQP